MLTEIAEAHGLESPTAVALAWIMAKAPYVFPIVGGRRIEHLEQNIQALQLKLTDEEVHKIEGELIDSLLFFWFELTTKL